MKSIEILLKYKKKEPFPPLTKVRGLHGYKSNERPEDSTSTLTISTLLRFADMPLKIRPVIDHGSWRGIYAEAVLIVDRNADYVPISTIKPILKELASGMPFEDWKGGQFSFDKYTNVHFEPEKGSYVDLYLPSILDPESARYLKKHIAAEEFATL